MLPVDIGRLIHDCNYKQVCFSILNSEYKLQFYIFHVRLKYRKSCG